MTTSIVRDIETLRALYGAPTERSLKKELDHLSEHYRTVVEKAPFLILATSGPDGLDCSPRGDPAGFVRVVDPRTVLIPDRLGNNRVDSLSNILADPRVALLFLVPGIGETLRINGTAEIDTDPDLCHSFAINGKPARSVIRVHVATAYFQCQKAIVRSRLWKAEAQVPRSEVPTAGMMLDGLMPESFDIAAYDVDNARQTPETVY